MNVSGNSDIDFSASRSARCVLMCAVDALLINVRVIVGPRPVPERELHRYGAQRSAYEQMRPGLTGLWQVSGRNALSYRARIALDAQYARSASFWFDLKILCATLREVAFLNGR